MLGLHVGFAFLHFFCWDGGGGEHDMHMPCHAQSFADGVEGAFSEFGAQSEYDPVVPGGSVNDGVLSDEGSSRWVLFHERTLLNTVCNGRYI